MRHHNPKRHRILHQATQAVCSTGFSRQDTIPAKAGTTSIEFELMQNPSKRGIKRIIEAPRLRVGLPFALKRMNK